MRMQTGELGMLLQGFYPESEVDYFDVDAALDVGFAGRDPDVLEAAKAEALRLLGSGLTSDDLIEALLSQVGLYGGGRDMQAFLYYLISRIDDQLAHFVERTYRDPTRRAVDGPQHRSAFLTEQVGRDAVFEVLGQNDRRIRAWLADPKGVPRVHVIGETAVPSGRSTPFSADGIETHPDTPATVETRQVAVLVHPGTQPGQFAVLAGYPELDVDVAVRDRYPLLPSLLGGYFGHDRARIDKIPVLMMDDLIDHTFPAAALGPVADQLEQFLRDVEGLGEAELRRQAHSLGACVQPTVDVLGWLVGLHRRMVRLDWGPQSLAVVRGTQAGPRRPS